jgi:hypothetical protein
MRYPVFIQQARQCFYLVERQRNQGVLYRLFISFFGGRQQMVFQQDKETGDYMALILEEGIQKTYECSFEACKNPICSCRTVDVILVPA